MDLALDSNGDLAIVEEEFQLVTGAAEVKQRLEFAIDVQRGEWFLVPSLGLRYFDIGDGSAAVILKKGPNIPAIVADIKRVILETDGVISLLSFDQEFNGQARTFTATFSVLVDDGSTIDGQVIIGDGGLFDPEGSAGAFQILTILTVNPCPV